MVKACAFLKRALTWSYAAWGRGVVLIVGAVLPCFVIPIFVDALAVNQISFTVAWAQSENPVEQGSVQGEEQESAPAEEGESASAVEQESASADEQEEEEEQIEENIIDRIHAALSGYVSGTAGKVDEFFDDERHTAEVNYTRAKLRLDLFFEEGENPDLKLRFNLSLALPRINKRLKMLVSGKPDEEETDETGAGLGEEGEEDNVEVALAYSPVETVEHNLSIRAGLRFKDIVPSVWAGPRWRAYSQGNIWGTRLTNFFRWYTDTGFRIDTILDFERPITEDFFYRQTLRGKWDQDKDRYDYDLIFKLFQRLKRKKGLEYELRYKFKSTTDQQLDTIIVTCTYRQSIWRRWLFFQIAPQFSFPEDEGFDPTPGILFRIESIIGKEKEKRPGWKK